MLLSILAPVVSALLLWAAFPPESQLQCVAVALAPMLAVSRLCSPKKSALAYLAFGFLYFFATLAWMPAIIKNNGPWPLVILGWAALAFACSLYFALFGYLAARLWRDGRVHCVVALFGEAVLWAGIELLRANLFTGFAWNLLGAALSPIPDLLAPARIGGTYLVSACVVLLNGVFATLAIDLFRRRARFARFLSTALPLAAIWGAGEAAKSTMPAIQAYAPLRVAMIQRNAPCIFKSSANAIDALAAFEHLAAMTADLKPDLTILPESAFAEFGSIGSSNAWFVAERIRHAAGGAPALIGGGDELAPDGKIYNAAALYTARGLEAVYRKQHLVPFGEYIPFDKTFTCLQNLSPIGVSLSEGFPAVMDIPLRGDGRSVKIAPLICYEDTDPSLARKAAKLGAQAIVLITNDAWFSESGEAMAHALQAIPRAVETGLPIFRAANSGLTAIITPKGEISREKSPPVDSQGVLADIALVPIDPPLTPYTVAGDWPLATVFVLLAAYILFPAKSNPRSQQKDAV